MADEKTYSENPIYLRVKEELNEAADIAIRDHAYIDATRQCAGGASYGGHLANWLQAISMSG